MAFYFPSCSRFSGLAGRHRAVMGPVLALCFPSLWIKSCSEAQNLPESVLRNNLLHVPTMSCSFLSQIFVFCLPLKAFRSVCCKIKNQQSKNSRYAHSFCRFDAYRLLLIYSSLENVGCKNPTLFRSLFLGCLKLLFSFTD